MTRPSGSNQKKGKKVSPMPTGESTIKSQCYVPDRHELYRKSPVGRTLIATLDEMIAVKKIPPGMKANILAHFDVQLVYHLSNAGPQARILAEKMGIHKQNGEVFQLLMENVEVNFSSFGRVDRANLMDVPALRVECVPSQIAKDRMHAATKQNEKKKKEAAQMEEEAKKRLAAQAARVRRQGQGYVDSDTSDENYDPMDLSLCGVSSF